MNQFYPTPSRIAKRGWAKFKNRNFIRILEPSAGEGHFLDEMPSEWHYHGHRQNVVIDVCEIDLTKHAVLREKGYNVVGVDFFQYGNGATYSHVLLNPPFHDGVKHVIKAFDIIWSGEVVAIINAETVRNPFSKERQLLVSLIEQFGEVEFIKEAFACEEAERKTDVEVALVYLKKTANVGFDIVGNLIGDLQRDSANEESLKEGFQELNQVAIPNTAIENAVLAFRAAVQAMKESVFARSKAEYYKAMLGDTMAVRNGDGESSTKEENIVESVQRRIGKEYDDLKDRAWASILNSTNFTSKLSSAAQKRLHTEFEQIKRLDFTVVNIYGFLCGLAENQGKIQIEMACDVFDLITRYHSENRSYFKGWRSNDKHRTMGMKIKATRFVIPRHHTESYNTAFRYETERMFADIDKVFALLEGRVEPDYGLVQMSRESFRELRSGDRVSSSYFDLRHYPGAATLHFFPRSKELMDRLNRLVGRHRQWLPPEGTRVSDAFWLQFDQADTLDKEFHAELNAVARKSGPSRSVNALYRMNYGSEDEQQAALQTMDEAMTAVLTKRGIDVNFVLEHKEEAKSTQNGFPQLELLAA